MPARARAARRAALALSATLPSLLFPAASLAAPSTAQLLVKFRAGIDRAASTAALAAVGGRDLRTIPDLGVHVVSVPADAAGAARMALQANGKVAFAEDDALAAPMESAPDNPFFPQGSLSLGGGAWGWSQTHTPQAWDLTRGSASVIIAVLDSGLKPSGLNFGNQIVTGYDVLNGTSDTATNAGNHGTYVAGTAVEPADTGVGNAGYCPGCSVMPVQVGTDSGFQYSDLATGITWAADHGARIINMSLGGTSASSTLASAVSYARSKGVVLFAAAGNSNCNCATYPAATPGVLGVAGAGSTGAKSSDSNYGSWVALAAPEGNMTSWPTLNGGPGYAQVGGTSLASPAAAGIAGLIVSEDPSLSGSSLEQVLETSATPVPFAVGYGEVDAMAALRALGYADPQPATAPVNGAAPQLLVETNGAYNAAPLGGAPQVGQVLLRAPGSWTGSSPLTLSRIEWDRCNADGTGCTAVGTASTYTVQSADTGSSLRLDVTYTDPNGTATADSPLSATVGSAVTPAAPAATAAPSIGGTAQTGQTLTASAGSWSGSPTSYAYQWSRCAASGGSCTALAGATGSGYALTSADAGYTLELTVTATNAGGSGSATSAPTAVVQVASQTLTFTGSFGPKAGSQSFSASLGAGTAAGALSYRCSSNMSLALKSGSTTVATATGPSVLNLSQNVAAGTYTYVVSGGGKCSFTLTVTSPAP